jgi:tetratricopeptide (TPR) repeat protein
MKISRLFLSTAALLLVSPPVFAQAVFESANMDAMSVGLGAGLAASLGRGALVGRTYQTAVDAQNSAAQALQVQTKAIQQYMKLGCQYETQKQWQNAEKSFRYVLQVSAMRDGVGSAKMVPTLQHLVHVSQEQGNFFDAIGFEQRVLQFAKNEKVPNPAAVINEQIRLATLYSAQQNYDQAASEARESYVMAKNTATLPKAKRQVALKTYAEILRKLKKDAEAAAIEQEISIEQQIESAGTKSTAPPADITASKPAIEQPSTATPKSEPEATADSVMTANKSASPQAPVAQPSSINGP